MFVSRAAANDARTGLFSITPDGSQRTQLPANDPVNDAWHGESDPVWSANGQRLAFVGDFGYGGDLVAMNADGSNKLRVRSGCGEGASHPAWSPDGTQLVYACRGRPTEGWDIALISADGSGMRMLTTTGSTYLNPNPGAAPGYYAGSDYQPAWSPDGSRIAFVRMLAVDRNTSTIGLYTIAPDGSQLRKLVDLSAGFPDWSPDGRKLVFSSNPGDGTHVYEVNSDGGGLAQITSGPSQDRDPVWSPDGRKIAFDRGGDIPVMNPDGSGQQNITNSTAIESSPNWQPLSATAGPANDPFASPRVLVGGSGQVEGATVGATKEAGEPNHGGSRGGKSIWFTWKAPADGVANFTTSGSNFDTVLAVYTGSALNSLTPIAGNDDASSDRTSAVQFSVAAGITYLIAIDGWQYASGYTEEGYAKLAWNEAPAGSGPPNDNLSAARLLNGSNGVTQGANVGATKEASEPGHAGSKGTKSIWFSWTAPSTGTATFATAGSNFDTVLAIYTGTAVGALTQVAANDNAGNGDHTSSVSFAAAKHSRPRSARQSRTANRTTPATPVASRSGSDGQPPLPAQSASTPPARTSTRSSPSTREPTWAHSPRWRQMTTRAAASERAGSASTPPAERPT